MSLEDLAVEDLAIDVGLVQDTEEYDIFISRVNTILDLGCDYSSETTKDIMEKCHTSELDIAKTVLRECRRTKTQRKTRLKWWQAYVFERGADPSPVRRSEPRRQLKRRRKPSPGPERRRKPSPGPERRRKPSPGPARRRKPSPGPARRPMSLTFHKPQESRQRRQGTTEPRQQRPMSPMFEKKQYQSKRRRPVEQQQRRYQNDEDERPDYESSTRYSDVPRWPGHRKQRRYR